MLKVNKDFQELCPALTNEEKEQLRESLKKDGCLSPIVLWMDTIVDGHHRYQICIEEKIPFKINELCFLTEDDAKIWIIKNQFARRNLTPFQRAELALKLEPLLAFRAKERQKSHVPNLAQARTRDQIGEVAGISHGSIDKAKVIMEKATDELKTKIRSGDISIHAGYMELMRERKPVKASTPKLPDGKYQTIVIDPPWPIKKIERDVRPNQGTELDYSTIAVDKMPKEFPVNELAADGCHLYLWVTQKYLKEGLWLLAEWGFEYQCIMTWVKPTGFTPYSWMYNTEHVLFGTKGGLRLSKLGLKLSFEEASKKHSRKPDIFYQRVMEASPGPRLDMFSREPRVGFQSWGFEHVA